MIKERNRKTIWGQENIIPSAQNKNKKLWKHRKQAQTCLICSLLLVAGRYYTVISECEYDTTGNYWGNDNTRMPGRNSACAHLAFLLNVLHRPWCWRCASGKKKRKKERMRNFHMLFLLPWEEKKMRDTFLSRVLLIECLRTSVFSQCVTPIVATS